jgi:LacI family transcriptional regulator
MMKVNLKEVAEATGVSMMTVSRALRNKQGVSEQKRDEIKKIAESMGYIPNTVASNLSSNTTNTVGVIIPDIENTIFPTMIKGIEETLSPEGFSIFLCCSYENPGKENMEITALLERRVDGIIWAPCSTTESMAVAKKVNMHNCPLVFMDRLLPEIDTDAVIVDDYFGAFEAVTHLINRGCKRIAHIRGKKDLWISEERYRGYCDALVSREIEVDLDYIIESDLNVLGGSYAMEQLLAKDEIPDAVFCVNDPVAVGAYRVLNQKGIKVPEGMSIVGFSATVESDILNMTTVYQDGHAIGRQAAQALLANIRSVSNMNQHSKQVLKTHLMVRDTS